MKKQFKTESKKLMELMINSIYTNKEIFLREIVSNASDALDKLNYMSLTDTSIKMESPSIELIPDKENRTLTIRDNGIGMNKEEFSEYFKTLIEKYYEVLFTFQNDYSKYYEESIKQYDLTIRMVKDLLKQKYNTII